MAARRVTGNSVPSEVEKYHVLQEKNEMKLKKLVVLGMTAAVAAAVTGCSSSGDTATNVTKPAKIDNGYEIQVPLFINQGDIVKIDTRTGAYAERVSKAQN